MLNYFRSKINLKNTNFKINMKPIYIKTINLNLKSNQTI